MSPGDEARLKELRGRRSFYLVMLPAYCVCTVIMFTICYLYAVTEGYFIATFAFVGVLSQLWCILRCYINIKIISQNLKFLRKKSLRADEGTNFEMKDFF